MKSVVAVVLALCCVAYVASQSTSTNPAGVTFFAPARTLALNSSISSIIYNTTGNDYADFYKIWVPSWVTDVTYTLNHTGSENNYLYFNIIFPKNGEDTTVGYSCSSSGGDSWGSPCDTYDAYMSAYRGENDWDIYQVREDFIPGRWQYVKISASSSYYNYTSYSLGVQASGYCSVNTSIAAYDESSGSCVAASEITNVTSLGASFAGAFTGTGDEYDVYVVNVPANVSRLYVWLASLESSMYISASAGYVPLSYYYADYSSSGYDGYNSTTDLYYFYFEYPSPQNDQPVYFTVQPYYSGAQTYSIQFWWTACGASKAGYGYIDNDGSNGNSTFAQTDCQYDAQNVNLLTSVKTLNFNVPAYNSTRDDSTGWSASYASVYVPVNTVGALNLTCNASAYAKVVIGKNYMVNCYDEYTWSLTCVYPGQTSEYYFSLLSEDLYAGGWWSIAACADNEDATAVSVVTTGTVSAAPSASPSSGSDESSSSVVVPALLFSVVATVLAF